MAKRHTHTFASTAQKRTKPNKRQLTIAAIWFFGCSRQTPWTRCTQIDTVMRHTILKSNWWLIAGKILSATIFSSSYNITQREQKSKSKKIEEEEEETKEKDKQNKTKNEVDWGDDEEEVEEFGEFPIQIIETKTNWKINSNRKKTKEEKKKTKIYSHQSIDGCFEWNYRLAIRCKLANALAWNEQNTHNFLLWLVSAVLCLLLAVYCVLCQYCYFIYQIREKF